MYKLVRLLRHCVIKLASFFRYNIALLLDYELMVKTLKTKNIYKYNTV